jgi:hypothetical protein
VDTDPAASCYIPHNLVSGHWLTTLGIPHHHAVDALNPYALGSPSNPVNEPVEGARLHDFRCALSVGEQLLQYL